MISTRVGIRHEIKFEMCVSSDSRRQDGEKNSGSKSWGTVFDLNISYHNQ